MHVITLKEPLTGYPIFQSGRRRYTTLTDIAFISDTRVVAIHRCGCKAYLIDIDPVHKKHKIVHSLKIPIETEMIVYHNGKLYMNTYTDTMYVLEIQNNMLKIIKTLRFVHGTPYHGLEGRGDFLYVMPSTNYQHTHEKLVKYDLKKETYVLIESPDLKQNYRYKDITFLRDDLIVLLINYKTTTNMQNPKHEFDGMIGLFDGEFKLLDSIEFPKTQLDSAISYNETTFYATIANDVGGYIIKVNVQDNKFVQPMTFIKTADFPHGIDIRGNKLAYTVYSNSSVCIIDI
jgi:hypothetical protein